MEIEAQLAELEAISILNKSVSVSDFKSEPAKVKYVVPDLKSGTAKIAKLKIANYLFFEKYVNI